MTEQSNNISANKRIVKNTIILYINMFYGLLISLFTARVILQSLGFTDYGLYNVVGSVTTMFVFLRSAMGNATNRYITVAISKGDEHEKKKIFSTCLIVHTIIAALIIVLCEVVGLWLFQTKMEIPADRMTACFWVLQFSIATCALGVFCVPYDAVIIAHEKMSAFAFINSLSSTLNLAIAFAIMYLPSDKLILYAGLLFTVQLLNRFIYSGYCQKHFPESKFARLVDIKQIKEMFVFAFWNLFGNLASIACTPILNIFLNIFFGPVVNAARGIAVQIQSVVNNFITNFQMAVIPQITKSYTVGDLQRMQNLIITSSKLTYYIFLLMALPIALEAKTILSLWLGDVPDHTIAFTRISLMIMLITAWIQPLQIANLATGRIKTFQTWRGIIMILMVPISYIALKMKCTPEIVFIVQFVITSATHATMLFIIRPLISLSLRTYTIQVILKPIFMTLIASIIPLALHYYLCPSLLTMLVICMVSILCVLITVCLLGLNDFEKQLLLSNLRPIFNNIRNR